MALPPPARPTELRNGPARRADAPLHPPDHSALRPSRRRGNSESCMHRQLLALFASSRSLIRSAKGISPFRLIDRIPWLAGFFASRPTLAKIALYWLGRSASRSRSGACFRLAAAAGSSFANRRAATAALLHRGRGQLPSVDHRVVRFPARITQIQPCRLTSVVEDEERLLAVSVFQSTRRTDPHQRGRSTAAPSAREW